MELLGEYSFVGGVLLFDNKVYDVLSVCSALRNTLYVRNCKSTRLSVRPDLFRVTKLSSLLISETSSHATRLMNQIRTAGCMRC